MLELPNCAIQVGLMGYEKQNIEVFNWQADLDALL
jgi:hypothetical protein